MMRKKMNEEGIVLRNGNLVYEMGQSLLEEKKHPQAIPFLHISKDKNVGVG
jgi:hypothetical protein